MCIAYLDCFSGISGDMFLGALVDAGVPTRALEETVAALGLGAKLGISRVMRSGISATKVDVFVGDEKDLPREEYWKQQQHEHEHQHLKAPEQGHRFGDPGRREAHEHRHSHSKEHHGSGTSHSHGRGLSEIRQVIAAAPISERARKTAIAAFEALGAAEAKIHNTDIEAVHFHEVGAVDAIVDIVCAAVGAEALGVDEWISSPLNVGGGVIQCAHGTFPVPAPATLELLAGAPLYSSGVEAELVTPTGAAIVKTLVTRYAQFPRLKLERAGYGAGSRDFPAHPNVLRISVGEAVAESDVEPAASGLLRDELAVLECTLDDLNPQIVGYLTERLLAEGALDAFAAPVQMKKNRPGTLLTALARPQDAERLARIIFAESTTLGVRVRREPRLLLARRSATVQTPWGEVGIKVGSLNGTVANIAPEYEDCRRIAAQHRIPLKQVLTEAVRLYLAAQPAPPSGETREVKSQNG